MNNEETADRLSLTVQADAVRCASCGEEIWIAEDSCPECGVTRTPGTEAEAHLYRARVAVFGPVVTAFREPIGETGMVPLSDRQYLRFLQESRVLDSEHSDRMTRAINGLDLSTPQSTRSRESREAAQEMVRGAQRFRHLVRNLQSLRPAGRFEEVHVHFVAAFEAYSRAFAEIAEGIVSWHPAAAQEHASNVQPAMDLAADEVELAAQKMDEVSEEDLAEDSVEDRLLNFVLGTLDAEPQNTSDLLDLGIGSVDGFLSRGPQGYAYFSSFLSTPYEDLPEGVPQTLYLLALMLSSQDDPAGVLDRAALFLETLNRALDKKRETMLEAAVRVQDDLNEAASVLLGLSPQMEAILSTPELPDQALRDFVVQTYGRLTEGCFRRVANLLLYAMFVEKGSPKAWEDISDWASFGEKHQWLADAGDEPAFQAALEGVEKIVRNSDAHCEVYPIEGGVRFVQTNFSARTKEEKVFSDDDLGNLITDLARTVLGLSMAAQLFQADNINDIGSDLFSVETPKELRELYLELFLAVTGLQEPEVSTQGARLTLSAAVPPLQPPAALLDYVKTLFFIREFYPESQEISLEVTWFGEWHCSVRAPADRLDALKGVPESLTLPRALALLFSSDTLSVALPERSDEDKLRELGFGIGCGAVYQYLAQTMRVIESGWSDATPRLQEALSCLEEFGKALDIPSELSNRTKAQRDELKRALGDVGHLYRTLMRVNRGTVDKKAVSRAEQRYNRGANKIERFAQSYSTSERLV